MMRLYTRCCTGLYMEMSSCMDGHQYNFGSGSFSESKPGWYSATPREVVRGWPTIPGTTNWKYQSITNTKVSAD